NSIVKVQSVFSHLVGSGDKNFDEFTNSQFQNFDRMSDKIAGKLQYNFDKHILNSSGIERFPDSQYSMVRLGIGIHGVTATVKAQKRVDQVATLKSSISQIRLVKKGDSIGYNRSGIADTTLRVATVAIGYADGFSRRLGNAKGKMIINGQLASVVGEACMDMCMLDVTHIDCNEGDSAIIFGDSRYTLLDLANDLETIPYEVLTGISQRVKRVYFWE
ncbi:MAG: alanine racemase, partial [Flavobacteriales bacterium]|nr:alanine racemase [Flavobacteriales bacterium]